MTWLRIIVVLVFVITFLMWAGQNLENEVPINNFKGEIVAIVPLWIVVLAATAFGIFFMGILGIVQEFRDKNEIKRLNIILRKQQEELSSLRNLPISDEIDEVEIEEEPSKDEKTLKKE